MTGWMLQRTGSDVGKPVLFAGLCRTFANSCLRVLPFKRQNMSTDAAMTIDSGEIGRALALQAIAPRAEPVTDMHLVLLKPHTDCSAQVIVGGRVHGPMYAINFREARGPYCPKCWRATAGSPNAATS